MRTVWILAVVLVPIAMAAAQAQAPPSPPADKQALPRMVATERAFAAATGEIGVRDGFLAFFAPDSVQIQRGISVTIVPAREALAARPLQTLPLSSRLIWEPYTGHASSDGSLGWLTGAYVLMSDASKEILSQGAYFSVWKRQTDGTFRVWLDEGISLPRVWEKATPFRVAPEPDAGVVGDPGESIDAAEAAVAPGGDAWRARLSAEARLHLDGAMPLANRGAIAASARSTAPISYHLLRSEVAGSDDLAVTLGSFDDAGKPGESNGSFVRVWKRDVNGRWRIVFQTETSG